MAENAHDQKTKMDLDFKDTLNLPRTDFPIRPNAKQDDPAMIARWEAEKLFDTSFYHNEGKERFILHDGPPYANGHIHIGHAYNKIIKDIITKSKRMAGMQVPVTPGWDCHGLPIEIKVTAEHKESSVGIIKACRDYAKKWIDVQREEFKKLGILMQWDRPYLTMDPDYESRILKAFSEFVGQGYIERKNKTVPWCPSCRTVLATAEIEYEERKDPSLYVLFSLEQSAIDTLFPALSGKTIDVVVWTTTPWTLPLNRAVLLRPHTQYVVLELPNRLVLVAQERAQALLALLKIEQKVLAQCSAEQLQSVKAHVAHPFIASMKVPLILDDSVMITDGTAAVHCAPGAGPEDYEVGIKNNLEIYCPVNEAGYYTDQINPSDLKGMAVTDGQIWVIKQLAATDRLLYKDSIKHNYPVCWRCHGPLIFRATKQWFLNLTHKDLKARTLEATQSIDTLPEKSINRLQATIEGRWEWCLSRQRIWGTPIPALLCTHCDYAAISAEFIEKIAEQVKQHGIEYWTQIPVEQLVSGLVCPCCGKNDWKKEKDILDVWFDAGISHYAVLYNNKELAFPADVYVEGKDQHRGWFQSSLLTSMGLEGTPPMRTIITHGFTVDAKGRKMSKSLGNGVEPSEMIEKLGTDGLRLWVASIDMTGDAVVSDVLLKNVQEVYRKIRNTCRFLLSNLYDFDETKDIIDVSQLRMLDQIALFELYQFNDVIHRAYDRYDFTAIFHALGDYCAVNLSTLYLDMVKDCLYVEQADGYARRSVQTTCYHILNTLTKLMAPILSLTAEQISDVYQQSKKQSIHAQDFAQVSSVWEYDTHAQREKQIELLKNMRSTIMRAIETLREQDIIKRSLDAQLTVYIDDQAPWMPLFTEFKKIVTHNNESLEQFFKDFLIVSQITFTSQRTGEVETTLEGLYVDVKKAAGDKCPRCWQWDITRSEQKLCRRCTGIVDRIRNEPRA